MAKEANQEVKQELIDLQERKYTKIELTSGRVVKIPYTMPYVQDKINAIITQHETYKAEKKDDTDALNKLTRQFYSKCIAAILMKSYFGLKLFWGLRWRYIYYFGNYTGDDYLKITVEAKKKAQEQEYSLAMAFLMDMTTMWTTMTKKEAEEYRQELDLVRRGQSLKNSQD